MPALFPFVEISAMSNGDHLIVVIEFNSIPAEESKEQATETFMIRLTKSFEFFQVRAKHVLRRSVVVVVMELFVAVDVSIIQLM
jgi:hypothetical protein